MVVKLLSKLFGSRNDRLVKQMYRTVEQINALEDEIQALDDAALKAKTDEFRQRHEQGETLDDLLPEAFAVVREAGKRVLNMRHFDVQLIGGMVLHQGKISEMKTGEGKTLVATLPSYLNAISGKGVHIVTVNDYLATRDSEWMGQIFRFLGLSVGVIVSEMEHEDRQKAYASDITYGTNNEFGFDYLRDNMAFSKDERVQRELNFAVVDEVDSILIDEARTPLIISGPADESSDHYTTIDKLVPKLERQEKEHDPTEKVQEDTGDYTVDEKAKQVYLTDRGYARAEEMLIEEGLLDENSSLYDASNIALLHHLNAALRAHVLYQKNVDYIVRNNEVIIVDEFTGRTLAGRRWSDGLHQAVEAKEGVKIEAENQTLASITFQNYFRLYNKLSGMTGTADTEAFEFQQIYGLEVVVIPTNLEMIRKDYNDLIFLGIQDKMIAITEDIRECVSRGQPVLVGTTSIETSEFISNLLTKAKVPHEVLNAKQHEREAHIVANAGKPGAVTIATNMAGRGTDIVLGGSLEEEIKASKKKDEVSIQRMREEWKARHQAVLDAGGLHIIGTERHESRRIDNQLRGRAGRQGDAGSSRFYLSLEDNLMRIFASDRVKSLMKRLGMKPGEPIEASMVSRAIENAQRKVEAHNFDIRKNLLEYDDVANDQRKFIYGQRQDLLETDNVTSRIKEMREQVLENTFYAYFPAQSLEEQWDPEGLEQALERDLSMQVPVVKWLQEDSQLTQEELLSRLMDEMESHYTAKGAELNKSLDDPNAMVEIEKYVLLSKLDQHWKEHLAGMDYLKQGIHLHGYAQKNPKQEYKRLAFDMFKDLLGRIQTDTVQTLMSGDIVVEEEGRDYGRDESGWNYEHADAQSAYGDEELDENAEPQTPYVREEKKVGRNEPCPCGSGKKFKHCHGRPN